MTLASSAASSISPLGTPAAPWPAVIDSNNNLGTVASSRRYKHDIQPMDKASEVILALKPVTFHYNSDQKNTPCFGLIAEEVAQVDRDQWCATRTVKSRPCATSR